MSETVSCAVKLEGGSTTALAHLQRVPCDELQADQRVEEFGQTQADIGVPVAVGKVSPPHLEMGLDEVEGVEVFHHVLKHLLALFDDAICSGGGGRESPV